MIQLKADSDIYLMQALLEERKLYCFVLDHLTSVIRNEVAYNATVITHSHSHRHRKITVSLCSVMLVSRRVVDKTEWVEDHHLLPQ